MKDKIQAIIEEISIPNSSETLGSSNRVTSIESSDDKVVITYNRNDISVDSKKEIEAKIIQGLSSFINEDKIFVKTISDVKSKPIENKKTQPAGLQVGHGPSMQTKKRIPGVSKMLAISSGKGGVGKSTVAVNLACTLKSLGYKVGLLDADIYGPSIPMLLGKRDAKPQANDSKKILPIESAGIKFMSFGLFVEEKDAVVWRGPMLNGVINQFLFDVEWGELDFLLIDLPPGTGDMQLSLAQLTEIDGVLTVSTPQNVALLDTKKGMDMFNKVKVPMIGMVENMSYFVSDEGKKYYIFGEGGVEKASKELSLPFLGRIPIEIELREGSDNGRPYMSNPEFEGREVWKSYMNLAKQLTKEKDEKKGFFSSLFSQ